MLNDGSGFKKVYLATGFTDLRRGIDGLARIIRFQFQLDPYDKNSCENEGQAADSGSGIKFWRNAKKRLHRHKSLHRRLIRIFHVLIVPLVVRNIPIAGSRFF